MTTVVPSDRDTTRRSRTWPRRAGRPRTGRARVSRHRSSRRPLVALAAAVAAALVAAGCGSAPPATSATGRPLRTLRIALDYTPNVNYLGIYAAQANGYFTARGIRLEIVPYTGTPAETLLAAGRTDLGLTYPPGIPATNAAGHLHYRAVAALTQRNTVDIAVLASSPYRSVAQLSGTLYGGFGVSSDAPILKAVLRAAGVAHPVVREVDLGDNAYQALAAHRVAYSITFGGIDDVTAELAGVHLREWPIARYLGSTFAFPDDAFVATDALIRSDPSLLRQGLAALSDGYRFAAAHPKRAEAMLVAANPTFLGHDAGVVAATGAATARTFVGADGSWGRLGPADFAGITRLLVSGGLIRASAAPPASADYTDALLP